MNQKLLTLEEGEAAIAFEFVKDRQLISEQQLEDGVLVASDERMPTAQSAIVLLILDNHRIVYLPKTRHAPTLSELQTTCQTAFRNRRTAYLADRAKEADPGQRGSYFQTLGMWLPPPAVQIVPLSSARSIEESVSELEFVRTVKIELFKTNAEYNPDDFFQQAERQRQKMRAKKTTITHQGGKEGLSLQDTSRTVHEASQQGTAHVHVLGRLKNGTDANLGASDMKLTTEAGFNVIGPAENANDMAKALTEQVQTGNLLTSRVDLTTRDTYLAVFNKYRNIL